MKMGKLIVIEGPDTAGKTTVINNLKVALPVIFKEEEKFLFTREPGNNLSAINETSERIRKILLEDNSLSPEEQAQLFAISRRSHTNSIIEKLKEGYNIITDRFILSSLVYQGIEIGYDKVLEYNKPILNLFKKNNIEIHNIVMTIDNNTYYERISKKEKDAMEQVSDEIAKARIQFHKETNTLEKFNVGKIHSINANDTVRNSTMLILNKINQIIN